MDYRKLDPAEFEPATLRHITIENLRDDLIIIFEILTKTDRVRKIAIPFDETTLKSVLRWCGTFLEQVKNKPILLHSGDGNHLLIYDKKTKHGLFLGNSNFDFH